jgi:predicted deacylase
VIESFELFGRPVTPGERSAFRAPVGELNDGSPLSVPVLVARGLRDGPTMLLAAGVHGDEYLGPIAIQNLLAEVDPMQLSGVLIGVPVMGPLAYLSRSRAGVLDYEHFNLNRLWPGDPAAFLTQRMASKVFDEVVRKADYLLDYHEGGVGFVARYLLLGGSQSTSARVGPRQLELARAFGMGIPIAYRTTTDDAVRVGKLGNLTEAAGQIGVPAISVELGGGGSYRPNLLEAAMAGTRRVLRQIGLTPGGPPDPDPDQVIVRETTWLRPSRGGLIVPTEAAVLGARVAAGTVIAHVVDLLGVRVEELAAPHDAVILDIRLFASVYPGDWTYHLAKL